VAFQFRREVSDCPVLQGDSELPAEQEYRAHALLAHLFHKLIRWRGLAAPGHHRAPGRVQARLTARKFHNARIPGPDVVVRGHRVDDQRFGDAEMVHLGQQRRGIARSVPRHIDGQAEEAVAVEVADFGHGRAPSSDWRRSALRAQSPSALPAFGVPTEA